MAASDASKRPMRNPLQEQLLKAGLVKKNQVAQAVREQAKKHKGARVVNEHGSVNFNGLNTRNVADAKSSFGGRTAAVTERTIDPPPPEGFSSVIWIA